MSNIRGLFSLVLATSVGIASGYFVFDPAFREQRKEQEEANEREMKKQVENISPLGKEMATSRDEYRNKDLPIEEPMDGSGVVVATK